MEINENDPEVKYAHLLSVFDQVSDYMLIDTLRHGDDRMLAQMNLAHQIINACQRVYIEFTTADGDRHYAQPFSDQLVKMATEATTDENGDKNPCVNFSFNGDDAKISISLYVDVQYKNKLGIE